MHYFDCIWFFKTRISGVIEKICNQNTLPTVIAVNDGNKAQLQPRNVNKKCRGEGITKQYCPESTQCSRYVSDAKGFILYPTIWRMKMKLFKHSSHLMIMIATTLMIDANAGTLHREKQKLHCARVAMALMAWVLAQNFPILPVKRKLTWSNSLKRLKAAKE